MARSAARCADRAFLGANIRPNDRIAASRALDHDHGVFSRGNNSRFLCHACLSQIEPTRYRFHPASQLLRNERKDITDNLWTERSQVDILIETPHV